MKTPHQYSFEKLRVWQAARRLAKQVYLLTSKFPKQEIYGLTSSSRQGRKDQAHFSEIAYGSLIELACCSRSAETSQS
jgi:23S rRNA-intervening sequence protein